MRAEANVVSRAMLILTRRIGESVMIGDDIAVTVLGVKGGQVRLGVDAPSQVGVHREEIYRRIRTEEAGAIDIMPKKSQGGS